MGRKDKHKLGQSRNNPIFKVVGGKAEKSKNKPREVNIKLKNVSKTLNRVLLHGTRNLSLGVCVPGIFYVRK